MIKNILFDLGGVLLNIDFSLTYLAFEELQGRRAGGREGRRAGGQEGRREREKFRSKEVWKVLDGFEVGAITPGEFRDRMRERLKIDCTDDELDAAWNALLLDFPEERIRRVQELAKEYRVFLLSNTNAIHCEHYNRQLSDRFGIPSLGHMMERAFYSFEMGTRKPFPEIYRKALEEAGLDPSKTLFLDDSEENIRAAAELGIMTELVTKERGVMEVFANERSE